MRDVALESSPLGDGERLHQVPSREVRAADVSNFSAAHELIEGAEHLIDRSQRVEGVELVQIDVVGPEPAQTGFAGGDQVGAG